MDVNRGDLAKIVGFTSGKMDGIIIILLVLVYSDIVTDDNVVLGPR